MFSYGNYMHDSQTVNLAIQDVSFLALYTVHVSITVLTCTVVLKVLAYSYDHV